MFTSAKAPRVSPRSASQTRTRSRTLFSDAEVDPRAHASARVRTARTKLLQLQLPHLLRSRHDGMLSATVATPLLKELRATVLAFAFTSCSEAADWRSVLGTTEKPQTYAGAWQNGWKP
eukprot:208138-Pleurochrysis_carterae.AAC.1